MHHVPLAVALAPTLTMVIGFASRSGSTSAGPAMPVALAEQHDVLYRFLLNKWYFDEIYDFSVVRPTLWLGRLLWRLGDGWLIDGFGPDGVSARVLDVTRNVVRLQTGYLYHYAFAMLIGVAALHHLVHVRRGPLMIGWPILSVTTSCRCSARCSSSRARRRRGARRNARWVALWTTLVTFVISLILVWRFDPASPEFQFVEERPWLGGATAYRMGVDGISLPFVMLTTFLMPFCILASWKRDRDAASRNTWSRSWCSRP